ncbi:MAG: hypothetical protein V2I74_08935 [Erythrobacter sp.]|jgi:hypothetical protein|nr:hypothetical protein [Erythrobacter sp.]
MRWSGEEGEEDIRSLRELERRIARLDPDTDPFGVLSRGGSDFIQTAAQDTGFIIEKRERGGSANLVARRAGRRRPSTVAPPQKSGLFARLFAARPAPAPLHDIFTRDEVEAAFAAWYEGAPDPAFLEWHADPV